METIKQLFPRYVDSLNRSDCETLAHLIQLVFYANQLSSDRLGTRLHLFAFEVIEITQNISPIAPNGADLVLFFHV